MANDVLKEEIKGLKELIEVKFEYTDKKLEDIHRQTKLTNGRVSKLEQWRTYITGAMAVLLLLIAWNIIDIKQLFK